MDACFTAELETHLLTASHDADKLVPPVTIDASTGRETLHIMNGVATITITTRRKVDRDELARFGYN